MNLIFIDRADNRQTLLNEELSYLEHIYYNELNISDQFDSIVDDHYLEEFTDANSNYSHG